MIEKQLSQFRYNLLSCYCVTEVYFTKLYSCVFLAQIIGVYKVLNSISKMTHHRLVRIRPGRSPVTFILENLCEFSSSTSQSDDFASLHSTGNHRVSKRPVSKPPKGMNIKSSTIANCLLYCNVKL